MNLDPVHHGEVLVRRTTPHRETAAEVIRRRHAGERVERTEHVVDAACDPNNLVGGNGIRRRSPPRYGLGHDLNCLGERVSEQPDLGVHTPHRKDRLQVTVCPEPQRGFSLSQHDGETPVPGRS